MKLMSRSIPRDQKIFNINNSIHSRLIMLKNRIMTQSRKNEPNQNTLLSLESTTRNWPKMNITYNNNQRSSNQTLYTLFIVYNRWIISKIVQLAQNLIIFATNSAILVKFEIADSTGRNKIVCSYQQSHYNLSVSVQGWNVSCEGKFPSVSDDQ